MIDGLQRKEYKKISFLIGAGISVAAGIPDFRTPKVGLYAQVKSLGLPVPEDIFSLEYFLDNPLPFYMIARDFLFHPKNVNPVNAHRFMKAIEDRKQLSMIYTQNIDGLELRAGISPKKIIQAHGHMRSAHCISCKSEYSISEFENFLRHTLSTSNESVFFCSKCHAKEFQQLSSTNEQPIPGEDSLQVISSPRCSLPRSYRRDEGGIVKPDIIFFGEKVSKPFNRQFNKISEADLVIVMGTSLKVHPFSHLLSLIPDSTPLVIINRELPKISRSNVLFLEGEIEQTISSLVEELHWPLPETLSLAEENEIFPEEKVDANSRNKRKSSTEETNISSSKVKRRKKAS